jgi:hypothetical protein
MALLQATLITAIATAVLALLAIVIAFFAILALRRQSAEVAMIERQTRDQRDLIRQQGELLQVQRQHFELQVEELKASIAERQQKAIEEWVRKQQWPHLQLQSSRSSPRDSGATEEEVLTALTHARRRASRATMDV